MVAMVASEKVSHERQPLLKATFDHGSAFAGPILRPLSANVFGSTWRGDHQIWMRM